MKSPLLHSLVIGSLSLAMIGSSILVHAYASSPVKSEREHIIISPEMSECTGVAPMKCLQIWNPNTRNYEPLFSPIEGFEYIEGNKYFLRVQKDTFDAKDVPQDASTVKYRLIKVLKSRGVTHHENTRWKLLSLNNSPVNSTSLLEFRDNNQIVAKICNNFSGVFSQDGTTIHTNLASTKMACNGDLGEIESRFELDGATLTHSGNQLQITTKRKDIFIYEKDDIDLNNTSWTLLSVDGVTTQSLMTLQFQSNSLSAKFCNTVSGKYSLNSNTIDAPNLISTMMYCDGEKSQFEKKFQLDTARIDVSKTRLTLTTKSGSLFIYERK